MSWFMNICGYILCGFLGALAVIILVRIWNNEMSLKYLVAEANGQASMSRFQLLIFTFVIAISLFSLVEQRSDHTFPPIPEGVLTLLGISASTYAVGKGISYSQPQTLDPKPPASDEDKAKASADHAASQADVAKQAANFSQAAADQIAGHMETLRKVVQQTANDAASAKQAAAQASAVGTPVVVVDVRKDSDTV